MEYQKYLRLVVIDTTGIMNMPLTTTSGTKIEKNKQDIIIYITRHYAVFGKVFKRMFTINNFCFVEDKKNTSYTGYLEHGLISSCDMLKPYEPFKSNKISKYNKISLMSEIIDITIFDTVISNIKNNMLTLVINNKIYVHDCRQITYVSNYYGVFVPVYDDSICINIKSDIGSDVVRRRRLGVRMDNKLCINPNCAFYNNKNRNK